MLHRNKSLKTENDLALRQTEMRLIRFMSGVKLIDNCVNYVQLRQWLGIEDIVK